MSVCSLSALIEFMDCWCISEFVALLYFQVVVIPPDLTNYYAQAVECHVIGGVSSVVAPNMDVILSVDSVDRER
jgi:hypothetical protein